LTEVLFEILNYSVSPIAWSPQKAGLALGVGLPTGAYAGLPQGGSLCPNGVRREARKQKNHYFDTLSLSSDSNNYFLF